MSLLLRVALPALLLATVLACGGGDSDPSPTPSPPASPSPTAAPTVASGGLLTDYGVTDDEILLGHIALEGERELSQAMAAYFAYVNSESGVCGRSLTLLQDEGVSGAQALIEEDEVAAFVGNTADDVVRGVVSSAGVPELFAASGRDAGNFEASIAFGPGWEAEGAALAAYVDESFPGQTVGILYEGSGVGTGREAFVDATQAEIVAEESLEPAQTELTELLVEIRAADPIVLVLFTSTEHAVLAYEYMTENDWHPQVVLSNATDPVELADAVGREAFAGALTTAYLLDPAADDPAVAEHARIMVEFDGAPVSRDSLYAQAIAETVIQTLDIACEEGDMTRAGIMEAALQVEDFHPTTLMEGVNVTLGELDRIAIETLLPAVIQSDGTLAPPPTPTPVPAPTAS